MRMKKITERTTVKPNAWVTPPIDIGKRIPMEGNGLTGLEEMEVIVQVLKEGVLTWGRWVYEFEELFSRYFGVKHAYSVSSCTAALAIATKLVGVGPGDEVILPSMTFIATGLPALDRGARVRFADVSPNTLNVSIDGIERVYTDKVKAIYVTHMDGNPVDIGPIVEFAGQKGVALVEDCAHAPGAKYHGRYVGTIGDVGAFSFHTRKNITTLGEGGMVATNHDEYAPWIGSIRTFGHHACRPSARNPLTGEDMMSDYVEVNGSIPINYPLSDVQCAVGLVQLKKLKRINARRKEIHDYYNTELEKIGGITVPHVLPGCRSSYHRYTALFDEKDWEQRWDRLKQEMNNANIATQHIYLPNYLNAIYRSHGYGVGTCPNVESAYRRSFMLPIYPELMDSHVEKVIQTVRRALC